MNGGEDEPTWMAMGSRQNRFLRPVTREEQKRQARAVDAARATFSKSRDRDGSAYFCADSLTPEETSRRLVEEIMRVAAILGTEAADDDREAMNANDLELIQRGVFEPVFGEKTLGFRELDHPGVTYPVWCSHRVAGPDPHPYSLWCSGCSHRPVAGDKGSSRSSNHQDGKARSSTLTELLVETIRAST